MAEIEGPPLLSSPPPEIRFDSIRFDRGMAKVAQAKGIYHRW